MRDGFWILMRFPLIKVAMINTRCHDNGHIGDCLHKCVTQRSSLLNKVFLCRDTIGIRTHKPRVSQMLSCCDTTPRFFYSTQYEEKIKEVKREDKKRVLSFIIYAS